MRDPRDSQGTIKRYGAFPAGGADGRVLVVEEQTLNERKWVRLRIVHAASDGDERELVKLWFSPSALGPLVESLVALKAAVELGAS